MISHFCILTILPNLPKYTQIPHLCTVSPHHMYRAGFTGSSSFAVIHSLWQKCNQVWVFCSLCLEGEGVSTTMLNVKKI